jgi:hypothetical protein
MMGCMNQACLLYTILYPTVSPTGTSKWITLLHADVVKLLHVAIGCPAGCTTRFKYAEADSRVKSFSHPVARKTDSSTSRFRCADNVSDFPLYDCYLANFCVPKHDRLFSRH